eukprot:9030305-Ditylum_brightwellii.AAC.1
MGYNHQRSKFCRMIEEKLGLEEKSLIAHFARRSEAIALANIGIFMPNLKRSGMWASTLVVEEYMEHSHASKKECLLCTCPTAWRSPLGPTYCTGEEKMSYTC